MTTRATRCITTNGKFLNSHVTITTPILLVICFPVARIDIAYLCTKFDDFKFTWQWDAPFRDTLSSVGWDLQGRIQRGATGPWPPPPNHGWKIKTQLPRTHVGTAATINDHKTAHKHSSLTPFQTYDNTKKRSASGGLRPPDPLTRGSDPGPRWGHSPQTSIIGSRSALAIWPPPISTPGSAPGDLLWSTCTPNLMSLA